MKKIDSITKTALGLLIMLLSGSYTQITACSTGIFYGNGKIALAGNNEDWKNPFTRIWIIPAEGNKFGRISILFTTMKMCSGSI